MPRLSEREIKSIKRRLRVAEQYCQTEFEPKLKRALELYTGIHYKDYKKRSDRCRVVVNYVLHIVETLLHSVAFRFPEFNIRPHTPDAEGTEPTAKAALRYFWKVGHVMRELKRSWKDRLIYGTGIIYTGWLFETEDVCMTDGRHPTDTDQPDETPNPTDTLDQVPSATVREDRFFVKRINPQDFLIDPECDKVLDNAEWCGYRELRPLDEVKGNKQFKNTRQLKGSSNNLKPYFDQIIQQEIIETGDTPSDLKRVKLYHYFSKKKKVHLILTDEHDKELYISDWNWEQDRYPFRYKQYAGNEDEFFGEPLPILIEHQQQELNLQRSMLSELMRMSLPKWQTMGGSTLSQQAKQALRSNEPNVVVEHNGQLPASIVPIQQQPPPQYLFVTEQAVLADIQNIAGISQYQMGEVPTKRTPTAEVQAINSQGGARSDNDRQEFEEFCAEVALDCIDWLKEYSIKVTQLPIYDDQGNVLDWHPFTKEDIRGEYDIEVYVNSTTAPNNKDKLESISFFMQSFGPLLQIYMEAKQVGIDLTPILEEFLKSLPDIRNVNKILQSLQQPTPPMSMPMQQGLQSPLQQEMSPGMGQGNQPPQDLMAALQQTQGMM